MLGWPASICDISLEIIIYKTYNRTQNQTLHLKKKTTNVCNTEIPNKNGKRNKFLNMGIFKTS